MASHPGTSVPYVWWDEENWGSSTATLTNAQLLADPRVKALVETEG
jgi:hypothetical protein